MLSSVCGWGMINAVSADGLMTDCIHPWAGSAQNLYFVQWSLYIATTIFFVVPQDRWSLLTGVICKLSFTIYISYDLWYHPCCVHKLWSMLCLPMAGAETAFSHGQIRHSTCTCKLSFTIYMAYDRWCHPCCVHKLWSMLCLPMSGAETASSHGQTRHSTCICKLSFTIYMAYDMWYSPCCVHKLWSMLWLPMSGAETASGHGQTRHDTYAC